jgi:hypothetical protein
MSKKKIPNEPKQNEALVKKYPEIEDTTKEF